MPIVSVSPWLKSARIELLLPFLKLFIFLMTDPLRFTKLLFLQETIQLLGSLAIAIFHLLHCTFVGSAGFFLNLVFYLYELFCSHICILGQTTFWIFMIGRQNGFFLKHFLLLLLCERFKRNSLNLRTIDVLCYHFLQYLQSLG